MKRSVQESGLIDCLRIVVLCLMAYVVGIAHAAKVNRIEPTDWYVGMKNPSLQLMIYGKDLRDAQVTVDYPGVKIDSLVRLDSPNYLLVYLNVADAKAGEMVLKIDRQRVKYQLKQREKRGEERIGFTCADVLYQLMTDRFASGTVENDQLITMNHDTDRYLGNGMDTLALKQALALLLTVNRIPQLYYGVEILLNGTKAQFIPHRGIYVVARQYKGKTVMTILNGTPYVTTLPVSRYAEVIGNHRQAKNIFCGCAIDLTKDIQLQPRESLIIEF